MEKVEVKEMPSQEILEQFLSQMVMGGEVLVYFDYTKGEFVDVRPIDSDTSP